MLLCFAFFAYAATRKLDISRLSQTVITAEFSPQSTDCLLKILKNEKQRLKNSDDANSECDLDIIPTLITKLKTMKSNKTTFDALEASVLISALNHALKSDSLGEEELHIATVIRDETKKIAEEGFRDEFVDEK